MRHCTGICINKSQGVGDTVDFSGLILQVKNSQAGAVNLAVYLISLLRLIPGTLATHQLVPPTDNRDYFWWCHRSGSHLCETSYSPEEVVVEGFRYVVCENNWKLTLLTADNSDTHLWFQACISSIPLKSIVRSGVISDCVQTSGLQRSMNSVLPLLRSYVSFLNWQNMHLL